MHVKKNGTYANQTDSCKIMNASYYWTSPSRCKVFQCKQPDIQKKECNIIDVPVPRDQNVRSKQQKNVLEYKDLRIEIKNFSISGGIL